MTSLAQKLMLMGMALLIVGGLAACGKKGKLTPPDGATYPRQYPAPEADKPKQP
jgi:predicted small lipoprotein YifL